MTTAALRPHDELVPLADRQIWLTAYRLALALAVVGVALVSPGSAPLGRLDTLLVTAGYAAWSGVTSQAWRLSRRRSITVLGATLLVDGAYLAAISYAAGGVGTVLQYLVLTHLVTVTLLASFRTGFKVTVWHTLLVASVFELQRARVVLPGSPRPGWVELGLFAGLVTATTLATASFAALNERELRRRNYDLDALARLAWRLESTLDPEGVAEALATSLQNDFEIGRTVVLASDAGGLTCLHGLASASALPGSAEQDRVIAHAMRERVTLRVARLDPAQEPWAAAAMPGAANVLVLPLYADGGPVGAVLCEYRRRAGARIPRRTVAIVERCVSYTALALNNAWLHRRIQSLAATDSLTGLANRRTFDAEIERELSRATRKGEGVGCALVDVDHFKIINDTFGHQVGDDVLKMVAEAAAAVCRPTDIVARYGGEELAIILPGISQQALDAVGERLRLSIAAVGGPAPITASVGLARFPDGAIDAKSLVGAADQALYRAKEAGRDRVCRAPALDGTTGLPDDQPAGNPASRRGRGRRPVGAHLPR